MEPDEGMTEKEFQAQVPVVTEIQAMDYQTVQLSWDEVEEAQGYSVYRRVKGTEGWKWYAKALTNSYVDEKAQTGVRYEYTAVSYTHLFAPKSERSTVPASTEIWRLCIQ